MVHDTWLRGIIEETQQLSAVLDEVWKDLVADRARLSSETVPRPVVSEGDLVIVKMPFYEKGAGLILPQADGPYKVDRMFGEHSARLVDVLTGQCAFSGDRVAIERLARFEFPVEWATEDLKDDQVRSRAPLAPGDYVAARMRSRVHVCRIERLLGATQLEVVKFEVPRGQRYGPWTRRPWRAIIGHAGEAGKEVIPESDVLVHVEL